MEFPRRYFLRLTAGVAALAAAPRLARADTYPSRPIRLVLPFPPGGVFDIVGRPWADKVKTNLGTVFVDNQPGAGGSLAAQLGRAFRAGRLHDFPRQFVDPSRRNGSARASAARSDEGSDDDLDGGDHLLRHCRASFGAGAKAEGARRLRESQSRQAVLWLARRRDDESSQRRNAQIAGRHHRSAACALSRRRPGAGGCDRRTDSDHHSGDDQPGARISSRRKIAAARRSPIRTVCRSRPKFRRRWNPEFRAW